MLLDVDASSRMMAATTRPRWHRQGTASAHVIAVGASEASRIRWSRFLRIRAFAPSRIHGILVRMPEAAQAREMTVPDGSHIHEPADAVSFQHPDELFDGMGGVPDCTNGGDRFRSHVLS
jgi:hypothetical protein